MNYEISESNNDSYLVKKEAYNNRRKYIISKLDQFNKDKMGVDKMFKAAVKFVKA